MTGDDTRQWGPPFLKDSEGQETSESAFYLAINRNKRSMTLDISTKEGQEIIKKLVLDCDIVIENYKVGQLKKYSLDYQSLSAIKPNLIYCSITGFGQTGPYAHRAGYDFVVQGMGGFMSVTGEKEDLPGGGPQKAGIAIADLFTGMYATSAILAAVIHRDRTGIGQHIDLALLDVQIATMSNVASNYLTSGVAPHSWGNASPNIVPYQTFKAADGWIIVAAGNDGQFRHFVEAGACPELADDPKFATNPVRIRHRDELIPLLQKMTIKKTKKEWIDALDHAGVPCGPINNFKEVFENEQVIARDIKMEMSHPTAGKVPLVRSPMRMSATPVVENRPPPLLGEHTEELLKERLGLSAEEIKALRDKGVI
jgi:formyl-CoA transferase